MTALGFVLIAIAVGALYAGVTGQNVVDEFRATLLGTKTLPKSAASR